MTTVTTTTKKWWQSKTIWFNVIGLAVAAAGEFTKMFPQGKVAEISAVVLTVGNMILRVMTVKPIVPQPTE